MKKLLISLPLVISLAALLYLPAGADDTVTASVTPLVLSVEVNPGTVDYGTLSMSNDNIDRTVLSSVTITAENAGSNAKFMIRGSDAVSPDPGNTDWALNCDSDVTGTVGSNQFVHRFKLGNQPSFDEPGAHTLCSDENGGSKELSPLIMAGVNTEFTLQIAMPTDTTGTAQRSTTVTVIASAP